MSITPGRSGRRPARARDEPDDGTDGAHRGPEADHDAVARKILLDQLTGQARSRSELAARLARKQVPDEVASRLLDRFEEVGLVDDAAFAREWTRSRQANRGLSRRALGVELRRKGVGQDDIDQALADVEPSDERAAARELVRRRLRSLRGLDETTQVRRLVGLLGRKGYGAGLSYAVVREVLAEDGHTVGPTDLDALVELGEDGT